MTFATSMCELPGNVIMPVRIDILLRLRLLFLLWRDGDFKEMFHEQKSIKISVENDICSFPAMQANIEHSSIFSYNPMQKNK